MVTLGDKLEKAFYNDPERQDVEYERARYIHALSAISNFLRANNAPLHYAQRWNRLAVALNDANRGILDELLTPSSFGSLNAGDPTIEWNARADAALGIAALIAGGATRPEAAQLAQRKIGGKTEAKTYLSWWDQLNVVTPVAKDEIPRQRRQHRKLDRIEAIHYLLQFIVRGWTFEIVFQDRVE